MTWQPLAKVCDDLLSVRLVVTPAVERENKEGPEGIAMHRTLAGLVEEAFEVARTERFIGTVSGKLITYENADALSSQMAKALRSHGAAPGDRVLVQVEKSPQGVLLYLACIRSGIVFVPVNPSYTEAELHHVISDVEPTIIVRDPAKPASTPGVGLLTLDGCGLGSLAEAASEHEPGFESTDPGLDDPAAILYTSGTTGRSKGAVLTQDNLGSNAEALGESWQFRRHDVLLHGLPLFHTHGLFVAVNCVIVSKASMTMIPSFAAPIVIEHLPQSTVFMGVPTFYARLLADPTFTRSQCRSIRLFTSGSAPLPAHVHAEFEARTGCSIVERYGLTETSIITTNPIGGERAGTVGRPLRGIDVRIAQAASPADGLPNTNRHADEGPDGEPVVGMIEVRGPNVFSGYWGKPEATSAEFTKDRYFRTGDLGTIDSDGYITIVGRSKDLIITGGCNVYPKEVEDAVAPLEGVAECAVVGVPDEDLGERVVAFVVPRGGAVLEEERIRLDLRQTLAGYKVPKSVHVVRSLPRNVMGKVEKTRLRELVTSQEPA